MYSYSGLRAGVQARGERTRRRAQQSQLRRGRLGTPRLGAVSGVCLAWQFREGKPAHNGAIERAAETVLHVSHDARSTLMPPPPPCGCCRALCCSSAQPEVGARPSRVAASLAERWRSELIGRRTSRRAPGEEQPLAVVGGGGAALLELVDRGANREVRHEVLVLEPQARLGARLVRAQPLIDRRALVPWPRAHARVADRTDDAYEG